MAIVNAQIVAGLVVDGAQRIGQIEGYVVIAGKQGDGDHGQWVAHADGPGLGLVVPTGAGEKDEIVGLGKPDQKRCSCALAKEVDFQKVCLG